MKIIINTSSMVPIYEQIVAGIKTQISDGTLIDGDVLPSVRILANQLKISALTVKKAYDELEAEGFIATVHGKGSYVKAAGTELLREQRLKMVEAELSAVIEKAGTYGITAEEMKEMMDIILGENNA